MPSMQGKTLRRERQKGEKINDQRTSLKSNDPATSVPFIKAVNSFWDIYGEAMEEKTRPEATQ